MKAHELIEVLSASLPENDYEAIGELMEAVDHHLNVCPKFNAAALKAEVAGIAANAHTRSLG